MAPLRVVYPNFSACCDEFVEGVEFLNQQVMPRAAVRFQQAYESVDRADIYHNKYASYCGLARVLSGDAGGLQLCREAARSELYDGDVFLNLARAEWYFENRKLTVATLNKGLRVDADHPGLRQMREELGIRQKTSLPFLPRNHPLNQALGRLMRSKF